jgi:dihydroorotase
MLEFYHRGMISLEMIVEKMCHNPARIFHIQKRGFIREGYFADLVIADPNTEWRVEPSNILYKCGWSPFEGVEFHSSVTHTFVNGHLAYENGTFNESQLGMRLGFSQSPV